MNLEMISQQISTHITALAQQTGHVLVALFLAVLILVIGLYVSRWVGSCTKRWLGKFKFDDKTSKLGINELCVRFGLGKSPTYIIAFVLAWSVTFYSVVLAADVLHLTVVRDLFMRFLEFVPTLFVSVLILFAGLLFGKLIGNIIENSMKANNLKGGTLLARTVQGFVVFFFALVAVENLGIAGAIVTQVAVAVIAAVGLAFAIAVGLGARPLVEEFLRGIFEKDKKAK